MPALNFLKINAPKVEAGEKPHTIRAMRKWRFRKGDRLYLYTGMRTKGCRKLGEADCTRADYIRIHADWREVIVNGRVLKPGQVDELAKRDGFETTEQFFEFFGRPEHKNDFEGQLIWWDPNRMTDGRGRRTADGQS